MLISHENDKYRLLAENLPVAFTCHQVVVDSDGKVDYIFIDLNTSFEIMAGIERNKVIGNKITELLPEISKLRIDWPSTYNRVAATGERVRFEQYSEPLGCWYGVTAYSERPGYFTTILNDITEFKKIKETVAVNENLLQITFDSIQDGVSVLDIDLTIIKANKTMEQWYDHVLPLNGKKCYEAYHQREERCALCPSLEAIKSKKKCVEEVPLMGEYGQLGWLELFSNPLINNLGDVIGVVKFVRDITERKQAEEALKASEEKYREIVASIEEGYYEADLAGTIIFCNDAAARLLGYSRGELLGMSYRQLYKDPETVFKTFYQVFLSRKPDRGFTLEMIGKDGTTGFGELSISLMTDKDGTITGFRGVARDITERIRFEEQLKYLSLHDQLTGLYNRTFFEEELNRLSNGREYPVSIISADLDDLKLINDTNGHGEGDRLLVAAAGVLKESLRGSDIMARVGGDEFAAILPRACPETAERVTARIRENVEKYNQEHADFPLGLSLGVATAQTKETAFTDIYKQADDLMYRDKLSRSTKARNKTVQALLLTLAERDFITEGHTQRMEIYCRKLGERFKFSTSQLSDLALLAQVHDLGKVGIPDYILFKKGPLTDEEWKIMRQHSEKGCRIALSSADLSGVADLILKHHERWDGSGYPLGLKGEEIPIYCRILAVIDAFDTMTHNRPYSKAKSKKEAISELIRCGGNHFDPEVVNAFISILGT